MSDINCPDREGNTPLNLFLEARGAFETLEFFLRRGSDLYLRNHHGQSAFHFAAKYYHELLQATDLFLEHGANVNDIDNLGLSVLHYALQNPAVNLRAIEKLLKNGAYPDYRDNRGYPPIHYCGISSLQPDEKESVEKLLIQHSVMKKYSLFERYFLRFKDLRDAVVCFHFCKEREDWVSFRDTCITEILEIRKVILEPDYTLMAFLFDYSCNVDKCLNLFNLKSILFALQKNEYPVFREMLISAIESEKFELLIEDLLVLDFTATSPSGMVIVLSLQCMYKLFKYLPKRDLINFILAFYEF